MTETAGSIAQPPAQADSRRPEDLFRRALLDYGRGDPLQAQALCLRAIEADPHHAETHHLLGVLYAQAGRHDEALARFERAIAESPEEARFHHSMAVCRHQQGHMAQALASADEALRLNPRSVSALVARGHALHGLGRHEEALACYSRALDLHPGQVDYLTHRAITLSKLRRWDASLADLRAVLKVQPNHVTAQCTLAFLYHEGKLHEIALGLFREALRWEPANTNARAGVLSAQNHACDWEDHAGQVETLRAADKPIGSPFVALAQLDDPQWFLDTFKRMNADLRVTPASKLPARPRHAQQRIHIAYLCAEFHNHATSYLIAQVLELHDRQRFEVTCMAIPKGVDPEDGMRARIRAACDRFINGHALSDQDIIEQCRQLGVDIAVDLNGLSTAGRLAIWGARCAPVQINWLAFPGTVGTTSRDYLIADPTVIPPEDTRYYSEKVIWLPHTYQPNDGKRRIAPTVPSRQSCGLPEQAFVFCCFNNNFKIQPDTFDAWMRILHRVPGSVLWLLQDSPDAARNLSKEAVARGIDADRLVFANRMTLPEHLARHALADLFIDTWPYNAHTTASDALWAGLPVLTRQGRAFQARVGASLLKAIGLPELITQSTADYEELAVALARDPQRLGDLRTRLRAQRLDHPLFDCARFTRNLESAYAQAMARHLTGLAPDHLVIHESPRTAVQPDNDP